MMPNNKIKEVELIPSKDTSGWKVKHDGKEGGKPGQGPDTYPVVDVNQPGPHLVVFRLPPDKPGDQPIVFNKDDPMQIHPGANSPTQPGMDPEFPVWAIIDNGKTLIVLDSNTKLGDYSYRVQADNYGPILDPIIKNGGGPLTSSTATPTAPSTAYSMTEIGIALLIAFLVGFFVNRLFFGRPKTAS